MMLHLPCRLDIDVQLVTAHKSSFDDVRVSAALFQVDKAHPNGCSEAMPAVEVEVKDKDHWISLDANTKRSHGEAGTGGLALVWPSRIFVHIALWSGRWRSWTWPYRVMSIVPGKQGSHKSRAVLELLIPNKVFC